MAGQSPKCAHKSDDFLNSKRLVICCDGTWNNTNDRGFGPATNVSRLSGAVAHKCCSGMPQLVYYHPGAGTESSKVARTLGGMFGIGVAQDIVETYRFICDNYNPGDEIIIIGFSRGAFTARSIAGMICNLGFLNRAGLDVLPHIFHDYETWQKWNTRTYDHKDDLLGFTLGNVERIKRYQAKGTGLPWTGPDAKLKEDLDAEREEAYIAMSSMKDTTEIVTVNGKETSVPVSRLTLIARSYRKLLDKHQMSSRRRVKAGVDKYGKDKYEYVPLEGTVKAVGVWDTVGSLGMPAIPPFYHSGRGDNEIRFESLDVHPSIEHAFHAIALDEWRTAFNCTMWGKKNNTKTNLRQVWFPGAHCNVGGGYDDQQIATIAMAWMADQLTSIGVEFSKPEMSRIFHTMPVSSEFNKDGTPVREVKARRWGMGFIKNPDGATSYPDWLWSSLSAPAKKVVGRSTDYATRTPGNYFADGEPKEPLVKPNEWVHPCVRLRYLYDGPEMDDAGAWRCRALMETGGFELKRGALPDETKRRPGRVEGATNAYLTVAGAVKPYYGVAPMSSEHPLVQAEQPFESDLFQLPEPAGHWYWEDKHGRKLEEEYIGMWERMYIQINEKLVGWQEKIDAEKKRKEEEKRKEIEANQWRITKAFKSIGDSVGSAYDSVTSVFVATPPARPKPKEDIPKDFGYWDLVSWQEGNPTPVKAQ
ncbi:hypothetical protein OQA88_4449 [Cercophora sp. LCS_1]